MTALDTYTETRTFYSNLSSLSPPPTTHQTHTPFFFNFHSIYYYNLITRCHIFLSICFVHKIFKFNTYYPSRFWVCSDWIQYIHPVVHPKCNFDWEYLISWEDKGWLNYLLGIAILQESWFLIVKTYYVWVYEWMWQTLIPSYQTLPHDLGILICILPTNNYRCVCFVDIVI